MEAPKVEKQAVGGATLRHGLWLGQAELPRGKLEQVRVPIKMERAYVPGHAQDLGQVLQDSSPDQPLC